MDASRIMKAIKSGIDGAVAFFAPSRCRCCHAPLFGYGNPYVCAACVAAMPWIDSNACRGCGFPAGPYARHVQRCFRCSGNRLHLTGAASVVRYRGAARSLVTALKFRGETELARPLAGLMAARLRQTDFCSGFDCVVPVALHPVRRRRRGFDQARLLAGLVAESSGKPLRADVLRREVYTMPQAFLRREARLSNVLGAFVAEKKELAGARVLLVDDVMTTGATMSECAKACRAAGAVRVYALTFAR